MTLEIYGRKAVYTEGSNVAVTDKGDIALGGEVFRGSSSQLFVPLDSFCRIFGMKWAYAKRNNFITIESSNESHPVPYQP